MKRIKLYALFLLCSLSSVAFGQSSPQRLQRLLPCHTSLTVAGGSRSTLSEDSGNNNLIVYIFELDSCVDFSVTLENTELENVNMCLLDEKEQPIAYSENSRLDVMSLFPGTYYLLTEGIRKNGVFSMNVETKPSQKMVIDLGSYSESFQIECDEQDTRQLVDAYRPADWPWENSPNDIFYRFTLDTPMFLLAGTTTNLDTVAGVLYCLEEDPNTGQLVPIISMQGRFLKRGTYYMVAEGPVDNDGVAIDCKMKTTIVGFPNRYTVPLGSSSTNTQQTLTNDTHRTSSEHGSPSRNDVYYSFDLKRPMRLSVSLNGSSDLSNINLYLLDGSDNEIASSTSGSLFVEKVLWGNHYLMVEGQDRDGMFSVNFELEPLENSIDLGKVSETKTFSETFNTTNSENNFGLPTNEIFYKLQLTRAMDISVSNSTSYIWNPNVTNVTAIYLLDADKNIIQSAQDGKGFTVEGLPAGTYYVVSEGKNQNQKIVTKISTTYHEPNPDEDPGKDPDPDPEPDKTPDIDKDMGKHNYIMTRTYTQANGSDSRFHINYFDGLGRASNSILMGASPLGKDIVTRQDYDAMGRSSREWLPRVSAFSNGKYLTPAEFEDLSSGIYTNDTHPYSMPVYESSPLNRVVEQYGPGQDWHNNYKSVSTTYKANISGDAVLNCKFYAVGGTNQSPTLSQTGNYATGQLYVTEVKDEDGNKTYEFKDKLGQVVLTRQMKESIAHDTYYVYDDFGNKCFVLPPRIQDEGISQTKLDELAYQYRYNARNRQIAKKLPGCGWIYYIYDKADRLVFSQDSIQRKKGEWMFTIPDVFGRVVLTGTCKDAIDVTNKTVEGIYSSTDGYKGYSIQISGVSAGSWVPSTILSANYYDSYDFRDVEAIGIPSTGTDYNAETGYGTQYTGGAKGLLTGTLTAQMNADGTPSSAYLSSVMYYDNRGRVIQTKSNNALAGGSEQEYLAYDFVGNITQRKHVHQAAGKTTQTEIYKYEYDHEGRLLTTTHKFNAEAEVTLANNTYDELGRLKTDKRSGNAKLKTDYEYNVRSWTKSITNPLFSQTLYYNNKRGIGTLNTPSYNGNISGMDWTGGKGYNFTYDGLSRLTKADYLANNVGGIKFNTSYSYDKHGNMLTLSRYGNQSVVIDNLAFTYQGNQLMKTDDTAANSTLVGSMDFTGGTNTGDDYAYDANGNLTKDLNKNITNIEYNVLNLPSKVTFGDGNSVSYVYAADGRKLQAVHEINGTTTVTDYVGNMIYENGTLKRTLVDGGYIEDNGYFFYLKDHLGNSRVVADANGAIVQTSDYYPFGMEFASNTNGTMQPYKYNGKELDTKGGLNLYDYGARHYDPALGRFMTMDPLAEKYYSISPYTYCLNNPLKYVDSDGRQVIPVPLPAPVPFPIYYPTSSMDYRYPTTYEVKQAVNNGVNSAVNFVKSSFALGIFATTSTVIQATSPEYDHQRNREKKEKRELDQNQANVAKSIDTNVSGMMPNGDPAPKRNPNGGGKKTKIGTGVLIVGAGALSALETSNPKPGTEDAIQAHTNKEKERIQKKEPTIWENIINYFTTNKNK